MVFWRELNAYSSYASNKRNVHKPLSEDTVFQVVPMGCTMPCRKDMYTTIGDSSPPNSSQYRHLQKIVEISLPKSRKDYRSSWELGFLFQSLHLTNKIRAVMFSQVVSLLIVPLKGDKIDLGKKWWCKWDKLQKCTTFHRTWEIVFLHSRMESLKPWNQDFIFFTFHVRRNTIIS